MNIVDAGDVVRITGTFRNSTGALADPSALSASYRFGTATPITKTYPADPELVKLSTGIYYIDIDTTDKDVQSCYFRFSSTGTGQSAAEGQFYVRKSRF